MPSTLANDGDEEKVYYIYKGLVKEKIPSNITHVSIDPSVKIIHRMAFRSCTKLCKVVFPADTILEKIDILAFNECKSLTTISLPSSVKEIMKQSFSFCENLSEVVLPEGLQFIGASAFSCTSLTSVVIPSTVDTISDAAFLRCDKLIEVDMKEGVRRMGEMCFKDCSSLKHINIPSTITCLPGHVFESCTSLHEVKLPSRLSNIKEHAFKNCSIQQLRLPSSIKSIQINTLSGLADTFSIELPKKMESIESLAFSSSSINQLRNIAPPKCMMQEHSGFISSIEQQGNMPRKKFADTLSALKSRFNKLPIHRICYYQSYYPVEVTLGELKKAMTPRWPWKELNHSVRQQDCLGMTPLHILACSKRHHIELYQLLIETCPQNLVKEDAWGDIPLVYALWGNTPNEIVNVLVDSKKRHFPNQIIDGKTIIATLCNGNAPIENIKKAIELEGLHASFPSRSGSIWQDILTDLSLSVENSKLKCLLRYSVNDRLDRLKSSRWTREVDDMINAFPESKLDRKRISWVNKVYSKLAEYEELKETAVMIELALWKTKIEQSSASLSSSREDCRMMCGASLIIPLILPYLEEAEVGWRNSYFRPKMNSQYKQQW